MEWGLVKIRVFIRKLQWGHGREAMDGQSSAVVFPVPGTLQWGHGREAMDGAELAVA